MNTHKVNKDLKKSLTILVPGGKPTVALLNKVHELVKMYHLELYLSTAQNFRLLNVPEESEADIKDELLAMGATLKGPGKFPLPRVCVGKQYCPLGQIDTFALSEAVGTRFQGRTGVKPKFKIAISGCPASCSNVLTTDIGIRATKSGYELWVGGKGGAKPKIGRRIGKAMDEKEVLDRLEELVDLHHEKAGKKMRFAKLVDDPDFPFQAV